jgi:hypothetical protein
MRLFMRRLLIARRLVINSTTLLAAEEKSQPAELMPGQKVVRPVAPDIKLEALWDGRGLMPFRALDLPKMVPAASADYLADTDYILGVTVNGESRAYPTRFVWWHPVINDLVGKAGAGGETPRAITYCSVCNTGIRYSLRLNDQARKLDFFGLYNGVVTLCDRETSSVFLQVEGRFVTGPLLGSTLQPGPLLDTTWAQWKKLHPDTLVMSPQTDYEKFYSPKDKPEPRGYDRFPPPFLEQSMTRTDNRLPFFEKVLAVTLPVSGAQGHLSQHRAYPLAALRSAGGAINDTWMEQPVAAFFDSDSLAAAAFLRELDGRTLTFETRKQADGLDAFVDKETGTRWDIEGRAQTGPLKGKALSRLESHLSQWYGWVAYFPDTSIYGRNEAPQSIEVTDADSKKDAAEGSATRETNSE